VKPDVKDICAGALLSLVGLFFFFQALDYGVGTARRMGPGYFPMALGVATMVVGLAILVPAFKRSGEALKISWRPIAAVLGSILAFGILLTWTGLVPAVLATVFIAAMGSEVTRPPATIALAVFAAAIAWLIFVVGLNQPLPPFRNLF
jgi:hypothetical protein